MYYYYCNIVTLIIIIIRTILRYKKNYLFNLLYLIIIIINTLIITKSTYNMKCGPVGILYYMENTTFPFRLLMIPKYSLIITN